MLDFWEQKRASVCSHCLSLCQTECHCDCTQSCSRAEFLTFLAWLPLGETFWYGTAVGQPQRTNQLPDLAGHDGEAEHDEDFTATGRLNIANPVRTASSDAATPAANAKITEDFNDGCWLL